jgi:hypothetical protein
MLLVLAVCTGNPAQPDNGSFDCPSPALPGSVCNATCTTGYAGTPSATCQPDGTYSAVTGACELIGESRSEFDINNSSDKTMRSRESVPAVLSCAWLAPAFPCILCTPPQLVALTKVMHLLLLLAVCKGNPQAVGANFACPDAALPGTMCNATCDAGCEPAISGAPLATCQPNGTYAVTGSCRLIGRFCKHWHVDITPNVDRAFATLKGFTAALRELCCHVVTKCTSPGWLGACLPARPSCRIAPNHNPFHSRSVLPLLLLRWLLLLLLVLAVCTGNPPNPADGTLQLPQLRTPWQRVQRHMQCRLWGHAFCHLPAKWDLQ